MKESYWGYWLILLGVLVSGIMMIVNNTSTTNTEDYYNLKEITQASMVDALDFSYYRLYGEVKMSEQKFVENFLMRFVGNVNLSKKYKVDFYDIYEVPPKVSVKLTSKSASYNVANTASNSYDVVNKIDAILEIGTTNQAITSTKAHSCFYETSTKLMEYIKGNTYDGVAGISDQDLSNKYPQLYSWKHNSDGKIETFKKAIVAQFPELATSDYDTIKAKYPDFATWIANGWITIS